MAFVFVPAVYPCESKLIRANANPGAQPTSASANGKAYMSPGDVLRHNAAMKAAGGTGTGASTDSGAAQISAL